MKLQEAKKHTKRVFVNMLSACQFLNKLAELEARPIDPEFFERIRKFFHYTVTTTPPLSRFQSIQHAVRMWEGDGLLSQKKQERENFKRLVELAKEMLEFEGEPLGVDELIVYDREEKLYKIYKGQF